MRILKIFGDNEKNIKTIKAFLEQGKIIVFPTDTVYGLVCDAKNAGAVKKIFEIKKRPREKPLGIFVKDIKMAKRFAQINKRKERFLKKVWPGKMTVVLKRKEMLPEILFAKKKTIGLRIPDYKLIKDLFLKINFPLAQTSANISGKPATGRIKEVLEYFTSQKVKPDLVLDAGNLKRAKASSVLGLAFKIPKILRSGEMEKSQLEWLQKI